MLTPAQKQRLQFGLGRMKPSKSARRRLKAVANRAKHRNNGRT